MRLPLLSMAGALTLALSACGELPVNGPSHSDIVEGATTTVVNKPDTVAFDYVLLDINQLVVANAVDIDAGSFFRSFSAGKGPSPEILVGVGDVVQVTIFESKSGGLFIPADSGARPGNYVTLPAQAVDHKGTIVVPYAGEVQAAGTSLPEIQRTIENRLANRAIEPKVIVTVSEQNSTAVSVVGDVNGPRKVKLPQSGLRILDVVAEAGGIKYPGYDTFITLQRGKRKSTVFFNSLVKNPQENIYVSPGDTLYVYREPRRFIAFGAFNSFGALGATGQFNFEQERVSLAEGVGKAGGLIDDRANPGQVFLYRMESRETLKTMGVDLSKFPPAQDVIPAVYRANFRDPSSYFYAQQFPMRNKDVIYVSNAQSVEVVKFLNYVRSVTSTVSGVAQDGGAARHGARYLATGQAPGF